MLNGLDGKVRFSRLSLLEAQYQLENRIRISLFTVLQAPLIFQAGVSIIKRPDKVVDSVLLSDTGLMPTADEKTVTSTSLDSSASS